MVAAIISDKAFDYLDAPVKRLNSIDAPAIYSMPLEKLQLPNVAVAEIYQAAARKR